MKKENDGNTGKTALCGLLSFFSGIIGGLFGAGGGGLTYYIFEKTKDDEKPQVLFAQTLLVTLPSAVISCAVYFMTSQNGIKNFANYIIPCAIGGICGAFLSKRASGSLKMIFSCLLIFSGIISLIKQFGVI